MKVIKGDILTQTSGLIIHGVNCQGSMGSGIALKIRKVYPQVYHDYITYTDKVKRQFGSLLGEVIYTQVSDSLVIASAYTQMYYGHSPGRRYVSYDAVDSVFDKISQHVKREPLLRDGPIMFPKIGCGLARGQWGIVSAIIEHHLGDKDITLFTFE